MTGRFRIPAGALPILSALKINGNRFSGSVPFSLSSLFLYKCLLTKSQLMCGPVTSPIRCPEGSLPKDRNRFECPRGPTPRHGQAFASAW